MGCGASKTSDPETERIPANLRPLLRRRYEKIKEKGKNIVPVDPGDTTSFSKEKLLIRNDIDDTINENDVIDDRSSQSFEEEILKVVPEPQEMLRTEKGGASPPANQAECNATVDLPLNESVNADEGIASEDEEETEEEKEDFRYLGAINSRDEGHFWPASPSFKAYLPETIDNEEIEDQDNHGTDKDGDVDTISQITDDVANENSRSECSNETAESTNSNEGSVNEVTKKRGKKGMKFKRVLPKPKARGMKNLLSVKSCYYLAGSGHDKTHLLEQKAAV